MICDLISMNFQFRKKIIASLVSNGKSDEGKKVIPHLMARFAFGNNSNGNPLFFVNFFFHLLSVAQLTFV